MKTTGSMKIKLEKKLLQKKELPPEKLHVEDDTFPAGAAERASLGTQPHQEEQSNPAKATSKERVNGELGTPANPMPPGPMAGGPCEDMIDVTVGRCAYGKFFSNCNFFPCEMHWQC